MHLRWAALLVALLPACDGGGPPRARVELSFADLLDLERGNVTTRCITAEPAAELERLGRGWEVVAGDGSRLLELRGAGATTFFDALGSLRAMELETASAASPAAMPHTVLVQVNGRPAHRLRLAGGRSRYRLALRASEVQEGRNHVAWELRGAAGEPVLRLRRLCFATAETDAAAVVRGEAPRLRSFVEGGRTIFEMPSGSYIDLVAPLPDEARWVGRFEAVRSAAGGAPLEVRAELRQPDGTVHTLFERVIRDGADRRGAFRLDLRPWVDRLARLRLRVGPGEGVVRWLDARVLGIAPPGVEWPPRAVGWQEPPASGRLGRPDVVVVLLDAARADAFSPYGGPYPTPALEALASEGTLFRHAVAAASWTGQSVPALLTGLYPDTVGVEHWGSRMPEAVPTLAARFAAAGYDTVLWSQHPFYRNDAPLRRGFTRYLSTERGVRDRTPTAAELFPDDRPTFAFVHLLPPHAPYVPPRPFRDRYSSWYEGGLSVAPAFLHTVGTPRGPAALTAEELRYVRDRYQENVAFADRLLGRVVEALGAAGRYDEALVVVLADHGEGFFEHRAFLHSELLYDEFLHVPLVVKWPASVAGWRRRVEGSVSLVDLAPTLLDGVGIGAGARLQGESLLPAVFDGAVRPGPIYSVTRGVARAEATPRPRFAVERDGWKLIYDGLEHTFELYDLPADPGERHDLAAAAPRRAAALRDLVLRQRGADATLLLALGQPGEGGGLDPEVEEQLRALGYL